MRKQMHYENRPRTLRSARYTRTLCALAVLASLAGCSGDSTGPGTRDEVAVFAFLYVGEAIDEARAFTVTSVRPVGEKYDREAAAIDNALVTLERDGAQRPDTLLRVGPGRYANPGIVIDSLTTYRLRVEIPGDRVLTAVTTTPHPFDVRGGPPSPPRPVAHAALQDSFPMLVSCSDPEQIFLVDVYCTENWEEARYINPFGSHDRPDDYDEYGRDDGQPRHIFAYFRIRHIVQEAGRYRIDFYNAMLAFYGGYDVNLLSIDENYYNYLYRDHPEENGGIAGGIGVFGAAARRSWRVDVAG